MFLRKLILAILLLLLWGTVALQAQTDISRDYVNAVDTLVQLSTKDGMTTNAMLNSMLQGWKEQYPGVPEEIFNEITTRLKKEMKEKMSVSVAKVYFKYFTIDEVRKLIDFYRTPIGRKLSNNLPKMTPELFQKGEEIGRSVLQKYIDELNSFDI